MLDMLNDKSVDTVNDENKSMSLNIITQEDYVPSDEKKNNQMKKKTHEKKKKKKKKNTVINNNTALELETTPVYIKSNDLNEHTIILDQNKNKKSPLNLSKLDKLSLNLDQSWMTNNSNILNYSMIYSPVNQNNINENDQSRLKIRKSGKKKPKTTKIPALKIIPEEEKKVIKKLNKGSSKKTSLVIDVINYDAEESPAIQKYENSNSKRESKEVKSPSRKRNPLKNKDEEANYI